MQLFNHKKPEELSSNVPYPNPCWQHFTKLTYFTKWKCPRHQLTQAHVHSPDILIKFTGDIFLSSNNTKHIYDWTLIILSKYSILNMDIAGSNRPLKIFLFPFSITLVFLSFLFFFDDLKKRKFSFTKVKHKELM